MKRALQLTLGVLTAVGGFVDIGDIVASGTIGARYGLRLTWVLVVGVIFICAFAEMSGRVVAVTGRPVFDLIRERLGPHAALLNLCGSFLVTLLTLAAQIGGIALVIELATGLDHLLWVLPVVIGLWVVVWHIGFQRMEQGFGLAGLSIVVFAVAVWWLDPDWSALTHQVTHPTPPTTEPVPTYLFSAVTLFAAAMTPYEVFFFSSGGVEEKWTPASLGIQRTNVLLGFPLGGLLSLGIAAAAATTLLPMGVDVQTLGQVALPIAIAFGLAGTLVALFAFFATTVGAALETGLSCGYMVAQYFGWSWGKSRPPVRAARFHLTVAVSLLIAYAIVQLGLDPIRITEYSLVFAAVALPLTYLPVLIVANDREYLGAHVNGRLGNAVGLTGLVVVLIVAVAAIPLMIMTGMGA
ncbi:divalent metal cation transporter [Nocardia otitidiscaviarum]|uniref:Divalent metal cation transporter n=1 Tax=Nocardia otitidiscaviarum TaxID=1823 RepID=A0A516NV74_9NOCA|nr:divalent metal cation transporter [Nocardia otitidiscaviarum]MCP9622269.1 divalent metal cation transporter [Nocardia otitidiscaviarum]QDP82820.1 divalent metal cation transporter [Nocardia otitidiscaviarum]